MYEFSDRENKTIEKAANWARNLGIINIALGILQLQNGFEGIINMAIYLAIGMALFNGGKSLKLVVTTEGNDITHLMGALKSLTTMFSIRLAMLIFGLVIMTFALLLLVTLAAVGS